MWHYPLSGQNGCRDRSGTAFIVVIMLTGILMIAGASLTQLTSNAAFTSRKINSGARALAIAEAGVADMLSKLTSNYVYWVQDRSHSASFADGTYAVTTDLMTGANVLITSVGTVAGASRTTILELKGQYFFDGCIYAGGDVTLRNPAEVRGDVHAEGNVYGSPAGTVIGNISACGTAAFDPVVGIDTNTGLPYVKQESAPSIPVESVTDDYSVPIPLMPLSGWYNMATNGGYLFTNSMVFPGTNLLPPNGVVYVDGDVTINNRSKITGTLVASGSIHINNNFEQTPFAAGWPCFIAGVDIREDNRNVYEGTLYCGNDYVSMNNRTTIGMIIAENNVLIENRGLLLPATNRQARVLRPVPSGWLR